MNKKILLFTATLGIAYLAISGYGAGPANGGEGNISGSDKTKAANCSGGSCHAAGSANTFAPASGLITLHDLTTGNLLPGGYTPLKKYLVKLNAQNTSLLPKFGFQLSCVKKTTTKPKVNAGTIAAKASTNTATKTTSDGIVVLEHTSPLSITGTAYTVSFEWTAPASGTGAVEFFAMVNAVNGTGTSSGDAPSTGLTYTINETPASIGEIKNEIASKIYPNPCTNVLNIEAAGSAKFMATVYDLAGRVVIAPAHQSNIDVSALTSGVYLLRLNTEDGQQTATFVKQ